MEAIQLLAGDRITFIMPTGANYSRAMRRSQQQNEFDVCPFLMEEVCRVNDIKQPVDYYLEMMCDDYMRVIEGLSQLVTIIR